MAVAYQQLHRFVADNVDWGIAVYRTPAGLRLLATHRPFDPNEPAVEAFFRALDVEPVYAIMCQRQRCFRARLTAKPWRIGIVDHMRPRPGVWPVQADRMPLRQAWIDRYEETAKGFAACQFVESLGSGIVHPEVRRVQAIHDEQCRARTDLPIA